MRHVALVLSRTVQSVAQSKDGIRKAVSEALKLSDSKKRFFECLPTVGRWDEFGICAFEPNHELHDWLNLVKSFRSFKKMDVQYATAEDGELDPFVETLASQEHPLLLLSYLRLRDEIALAHGTKSLDDCGRRLRKCCEDTNCLILRPQGWADFALLLQGKNIEDMLAVAEHCWVLPLKALADTKDEEAKWLVEGREPEEPAFSRSFSVLAYREGRLEEVEGRLYAPCVHLRAKPGMDQKISDTVRKLPLTDVRPDGTEVAVESQTVSQLGMDDAVIRFATPDEGLEAAVSAGTLLPWYTQQLLPELGDKIHTSELRLGMRPGPSAALISDPPQVKEVEFPPRLIEKLDEAAATRPLAGALRSMARMVNWGMNHDALYRSVADLYVHTYALAETLKQEPFQQGDEPNLTATERQQVSELTGLFSEAIVQRLQGSYYDMMSDSPELVLELSSNMSRAIISLWAIHDVLLRAVNVAAKSQPKAYWLVSKEGDPGVCNPFQDIFVFRISSSFLFDLGRWLYAAGHEIGHAAFNLVTLVALDHLRHLAKLLRQRRITEQEYHEETKAWPTWIQTLAATEFTPHGESVRLLYAELFADAFSCLAVLEGNVRQVQRGLEELTRTSAERTPEDPREQCGWSLRMIFSIWMERAVAGEGPVTERFARYEHGDVKGLPTPESDEEAWEHVRSALEACEAVYDEHACAVARGGARGLLRNQFLTAGKLNDYHSLFQSAGAALLFFDRAGTASDESKQGVQWLRQQLRGLRSKTAATAFEAQLELYHKALVLLGKQLKPLSV